MTILYTILLTTKYDVCFILCYSIFENDDHGLGDHRLPMWQNIESLFVSVREVSDYMVNGVILERNRTY
jgi:hypothetical protein